MDINNLKGLMEAYQQVNAPQEVDEATAMAKRGYDEAPIRQKIAKSTGGGEAADRASALEKKSTFGDTKKEKQRQNLARAQRGDFRKTTSSSPGLHGYGHKSDDPKVKAKQAARGAQRGALTPNEKKQLNREDFDIFDTVLEFLQVEGYAETLEEAEWLMANVIDEEAIDIILGEEQLDEVLDTPEKANEYARKNVRSMLGAFAKGVANKDISQLKTIEKRKRGAELGKRKAERKAAEEQNEEYVDEAQHARENPEKYEREQAKKSAPVRGEKTPMPPRGDKRREDFEKWYAANVR
jgi:hypothetical protein